MCTRAPTSQVVEVDENRNAVTREVGLLGVCNRFWLFSLQSRELLWGEASAQRLYLRREWLPFDVDIQPLNKRSRVVSLLLTAPPVMDYEKIESKKAETVSGSRSELNCAGRNAYKQLQINTKPVWMGYDQLLWRLPNVLKLSCKDIKDGVNAGFTVPLYNSHRIRKLSRLEHD